MLVRVDVVEGQAGPTVGLELRRDFRGYLPPHAWLRGDVEPEPSEIGPQPSIRGDEIGNVAGRRNRASLDHHKVKSDAQTRRTPRDRNCLVGRGACYHEARGAQDARAMREFDGLVYLARKAEIVGRDDDSPQRAASLRSRRK